MKLLMYISFGVTIFFASSFTSYSFTHFSSIPDEIIEAFKTGNSKTLSKYLNNTIEMSVLDDEGIYSHSQAIQILNNFFESNPVVQFQFIHKGGKEDSKYAIGEYISINNKFRITIYIKNNKGKQIIHQLRIQYDNN